MPTSATYIITGNPTGNINSSLAANGYDRGDSSQNKVIFGRVLNINDDRTITYELLNNNLGKSFVGTSYTGSLAYPSSNSIIKLPVVGEIVKLFDGPNPFDLSTSPAQSNTVVYYEPQPLNTWQDVNNNVVLNSVTIVNSKEGKANLNNDVNSYKNTFNGF